MCFYFEYLSFSIDKVPAKKSSRFFFQGSFLHFFWADLGGLNHTCIFHILSVPPCHTYYALPEAGSVPSSIFPAE